MSSLNFFNFPPGLAPTPPYNAGTHYWVRGNTGNDGFDGRHPSRAIKTMARAFQLITSGDTIHVTGNIREQLQTPAGIFDVVIVGEGNRPRHADAHTGNNGYSAATWKAPAVPAAATPLLKIRQQGWVIKNLLIAPPADSAGIQFIRDAASGDDERDSSHSAVLGCRFAGGQDGIHILGSENVFDLLIEGNIFNDATGDAIKGTVAGWRHLIKHNHFAANANHIVAGFTQTHIIGNIFGSFTTAGIDLTGGGGLNVVSLNVLSGTYSIVGGYKVANANDEWGGNFNSLTGGVTAADPA